MTVLALPGVTGRIDAEEWSALDRYLLDDEPTGHEYGGRGRRFRAAPTVAGSLKRVGAEKNSGSRKGRGEAGSVGGLFGGRANQV